MTFDVLKILVTGGGGTDRLASAVARLGHAAEDPDHVYVAVGAVQALADERAKDENWAASLRAMVDAARRHGWIASDGSIRAHVEWER